MKKNWLESGRIETVLALGVLVAVLVLFTKFYNFEGPAPTAPPPTIEAVEVTQ